MSSPLPTRFFKDYKAAYDATAAAYTQTLFNRLLFVHFVSRKGWLAFNGNKDYLNTLWHDYRDNPASDGFYAQRLDALFYYGMNTPPPPRSSAAKALTKSSARRPTATAGYSSATPWISRASSSATTS